jgi:hypothetical protein
VTPGLGPTSCNLLLYDSSSPLLIILCYSSSSTPTPRLNLALITISSAPPPSLPRVPSRARENQSRRAARVGSHTTTMSPTTRRAASNQSVIFDSHTAHRFCRQESVQRSTSAPSAKSSPLDPSAQPRLSVSRGVKQNEMVHNQRSQPVPCAHSALTAETESRSRLTTTQSSSTRTSQWSLKPLHQYGPTALLPRSHLLLPFLPPRPTTRQTVSDPFSSATTTRFAWRNQSRRNLE